VTSVTRLRGHCETGVGVDEVLRMYGALEPWYDKTWRLGEIELQA
jgi:hypothetical protein